MIESPKPFNETKKQGRDMKGRKTITSKKKLRIEKLHGEE